MREIAGQFVVVKTHETRLVMVKEIVANVMVSRDDEEGPFKVNVAACQKSP